jgi:GNAT superfamily N-acetyltransferase
MVLAFEAQKYFIADRMGLVLEQIFNQEPIRFRIPASSYGWGGVMFVTGDMKNVQAQLDKNPALAAYIADLQEKNPIPLTRSTIVTTDDWPYIYLESPKIPVLYYLLIGLMIIVFARGYRKWEASINVSFRGHAFWHFFFLGAAFLLLEVQNNREQYLELDLPKGMEIWSAFVRGVPVRAGGIGSVAAHPDARSRGLATALLQDAVDVMERDGMELSFLFTGIPGFYERLGWRIVRQPGFEADAPEAAALSVDRRYRVRRARNGDVRAMLAIYRQATAGSTGAMVRTKRTWCDARSWLVEDAAGCLVAEKSGRMVAYLRARRREYGYQVLEAEHARGHEAAISALLARTGARASVLGQQLTTSAPSDHALTAALRTLPSTRESDDVQYPMMLRNVAPGARKPSRRIDRLLPVTAFHFWNSDRI